MLRVPHWKTCQSGHPISKEPFQVQYYCDLDASAGYRATEEEIGQAGFVQDFEDVVWT